MSITKKLNPQQALQSAIDSAGNQSNLAKQIGLKNASQISSMLNRDKKCSAKYALKVSQVTNVALHLLRPDLYPEPANDANQQDLA